MFLSHFRRRFLGFVALAFLVVKFLFGSFFCSSTIHGALQIVQLKHARETEMARAAYPFDNMEQCVGFHRMNFACALCMCSWLSTSRPYFPFQAKEVVMLYLDLIQSIEFFVFFFGVVLS